MRVSLGKYPAWGTAWARGSRDLERLDKRIQRTGRKAPAIRTAQTLAMSAAFGGIKHSGIGGENGVFGLEADLEPQAVIG